jgi:choice-of-anchor B domain-containing protein
MSHRALSSLVLAAVLTPAGRLRAHDDDPKLLDRQPPYLGPGYQSPLDLFGRPNGRPAAPESAASGCPGYACSNGRLLSQVPLGLMSPGASAGNDCWGYVAPSGHEYALMGLSNGTAVVDVRVPGTPVVVAHLPGPTSTWRGVRAFSTYVYCVSEGGGGIQVFDMSQVESGIVTALGNVTVGGTLATHTVGIDTVSGFLYRCGGGGNGLRIYDLNQDPVNPPFVGAWSLNYVHDVDVRTFTSGPAAGKQVAFCATGLGRTLRTLDVTDKAHITTLDIAGYSNPSYSHQSWLSEDGRYAYLNDEWDEPPLKTTTLVFDVLDPASIVFLGSFTNGNPAVGHNNYVRGNHLYAANYRSGLRVFDLAANPTNPPEVAWLDTVPSDDNPDFNGLWSCYPLLPSGIVLGSDTTRGLFVAWMGAPQLDISFTHGDPVTVNAAGDTLQVRIVAASGAVQPGTEMLHYDVGNGLVSVALVPTGNGLYNAVFPELACDTPVAYYLSAASTTNIVWTHPPGALESMLVTMAVCPSGPFSYCVAKQNSCGGTPALSFSGASSASAGEGFTVQARGARYHKSGLLVYTDKGTGSIHPFQGGTLCLGLPVRRTPTIFESGATPGSCDGSFALDLNSFAFGALGGKPAAFLSIPGTQVNLQQWGRDTIASGSYLSNAGQYTVGP